MTKAALREIDTAIDGFEAKLRALRMARELVEAAGDADAAAETVDRKPKPARKPLALPPPRKTAVKKSPPAKKSQARTAAQKPKPPKPEPVAAAGEDKLAPSRSSAAMPGKGWVQELSAKEAEAWDLLVSLPSVSVDSIEAIFGAGQARHQGIFKLKGKVEANTGQTIVWSKADGYQLVDRDV